MSKQSEIKEDTTFSGIPISFAFAVIMSILVVIFALQNSATVLMKAFIWEVELPLSLLLFTTLAIGAVLAVLFSIPGWRRKRKNLKYHQRKIGELEELLKVEKENKLVVKPPAPPAKES